MRETSFGPWARVLSNLIKRYGKKITFAVCFLFVFLLSLILGCMFYYVSKGEIILADILALLFFSSVASPLFISVGIDSCLELEIKNKSLDMAEQKSKLLERRHKDNINRLNNEIDERKMALHGKHRAIEEYRKEISERKKTQLELAQKSMLLRSIVDSSPDLFYYRDEQGVFAGCNKMFEKVINKSSDELIGKSVEEVYPESLLPEVLVTDSEVSQKHKAVTLDVQYPVNNEARWFEMRKLPFINDEGEYIGLLAFGRDITSRKEAEQALATAYKDKGKFIATLSHELRTPLNGIVGLTRMILDTELSQQQKSWCNTIFSSAETLGNIFNDIIDLDKIDREQLDIATDSINLSDFINDVINFTGLIAEQKGLEFNIQRLGVLDMYAQLDPTRLRQVLWNLINNAVKFTHKGSITLEFKRVIENEKNILFISIIDTGVGIPLAHQEKIFDMYYKAPDTKGVNAIGSGIGLAVTKALISAMQGHIQVESKEGEGSRFDISIPLTECNAPKELSYEGKNLYILLVEDVPLNAEIATNLLEQRGHEVIWAETGEDALSLVHTEDELDLVLLDMQLPDINGDEIARQIRADNHFDELPIVILTANVRSAEEELEGIDIQGTLAKPINTRRLDKIFSELFGIDTKKSLLNEKVNMKAFECSEFSQLDTETIKDFIASMGVDAFQRSIDLFDTLNPKYCQELKAAIDCDDIDEYASVAHKFKGAAGSVGLEQVQLQSKIMELEAGNVDNSQLLKWINELQQKVKVGMSELTSLISLLKIS